MWYTANMHYAEFRPSTRLQDFVECYWTMRGGGPGYAVDGEHVSVDPGVELFFNLGDGYRRRDADSDRSIAVTGSHIVGIRTKPIVVTQHGQAFTFAVRFRPEGLARLVPFPLVEITHRIVDARELLGAACSILEERLYDAGGDPERVAIIEATLGELVESAEEPNRDLQLVASVRSAAGAMRGICDEHEMSYRTLERIFERSVGVPPKFFARVMRWRRASQLLVRGDREAWASGEYYDQSHFIRDFRRFTGFSPGEFLARRERISRWLLAGNEE